MAILWGESYIGTFRNSWNLPQKRSKNMKERDFLRLSAYPKPIDKEWQDKIEAHIKEHGLTALGPADNTNKVLEFNGSTFFSDSFKEKWDE